jgi:hypothetical protein
MFFNYSVILWFSNVIHIVISNVFKYLHFAPKKNALNKKKRIKNIFFFISEKQKYVLNYLAENPSKTLNYEKAARSDLRLVRCAAGGQITRYFA